MSDLANSFQTFSEWLVKNTGQTYNCVGYHAILKLSVPGSHNHKLIRTEENDVLGTMVDKRKTEYKNKHIFLLNSNITAVLTKFR